MNIKIYYKNLIYLSLSYYYFKIRKKPYDKVTSKKIINLKAYQNSANQSKYTTIMKCVSKSEQAFNHAQ